MTRGITDRAVVRRFKRGDSCAEVTARFHISAAEVEERVRRAGQRRRRAGR